MFIIFSAKIYFFILRKKKSLPLDKKSLFQKKIKKNALPLDKRPFNVYICRVKLKTVRTQDV